jgi:hypothetical protein
MSGQKGMKHFGNAIIEEAPCIPRGYTNNRVHYME